MLTDENNNQSNYWRIYLKNRKSNVLSLLLGYTSIIYFYYIPFYQETIKPYFLLLLFLLMIFTTYLVLLREIIFIQSFFTLEKNYHLSKNDSLSESFKFQQSIDNFQSKLLSKISDDSMLFRKNTFNLRTNKVKKKIDIFFNYIIDVTFSLEFFNQFNKNVIDQELIIEPIYKDIFNNFLINFKKIFIYHPEAFNLIALDNYFDFLIHSINKNDGFYKNTENEVNEYYTKNESLIEKRAERKHEYIKSIIGTIIILFLAILASIIYQYLKLKEIIN